MSLTLTPTVTQPHPADWALSVHLPTDAHAPRLCRHTVVDAVSAYDLPGLPSLADDGGLVATELMTNAWQHGRGPLSFRVAWYATRSRLRITVWDACGTRAPGARAFPELSADLDENGRGLLIVRSLAADWGQYGTPDGGKAMWAELEPCVTC